MLAIVAIAAWMRAVAPILLATLIAGHATPVAAAPAPEAEFPILDAYLATFDVAPDLPHCARTAGYHDERYPDAYHGTNALLERHVQWLVDHDHVNAPSDDEHYGDALFSMHRALVADYNVWRVAHGHAPVTTWDPATPIPAAFAYAPSAPCAPRTTDDPRILLPTWATVAGGDGRAPLFGFTSLCQFPDLDHLGRSLDAHWNGSQGYIRSVHVAVGGDMGRGDTDPRDPVFWAFKAFLNGIGDEWERACAATSASPTARAAPGPGVVALVLALGAAGVAFRRRR